MRKLMHNIATAAAFAAFLLAGGCASTNTVDNGADSADIEQAEPVTFTGAPVPADSLATVETIITTTVPADTITSTETTEVQSMTSSSTLDAQETTTDTRTRMRKD